MKRNNDPLMCLVAFELLTGNILQNVRRAYRSFYSILFNGVTL